MTERLSLTLRDAQSAAPQLAEALEPHLRIARASGVYMLRCARNDAFYIGSSIDMRDRVYHHFNELKRRVHPNQRLQRTFDKYGINSFEVLELEICEARLVLSVEQAWLNRNIKNKKSMNVCVVAFRPPMFSELPPEIQAAKREKHRRSSAGRPTSEKLLAVLAARTGANNPNFGTTWPEDRRRKFIERISGDRNPWRQPGIRHPKSLRCERITKDGVVEQFESAIGASRALGFGNASVARWCRGDRTPSDGSRWRYLPCD
jgi:group I intron endonuclease